MPTVSYPTHKLKEVIWRLREVEEVPAGFTRNVKASHPAEVFKHFRFLFDEQARERMVVILLNANNGVTAIDVVSEGTISASLFHPREVFRAAVAGLASSIILAHNHPSGNGEPSKEDLETTARVHAAGEVLGIRLLDHVIFTANGYTSLAERGVI